MDQIFVRLARMMVDEVLKCDTEEGALAIVEALLTGHAEKFGPHDPAIDAKLRSQVLKLYRARRPQACRARASAAES